jgi:predicted outer membrane protein
LERFAPSAVQTQDPKTKVSPRLKATVGLTEIEAVKFAMRSSTRASTWRASCRCFRPATYQGEYPR